jgi:anti-sigma B factor antagonist
MDQPSDRHVSELIVVNGRGAVINEGAPPSALRERVHEMINRGERSILLDVAQVSYADSMLLGELAQGYAAAIRRGATLQLLHVTERLRKLLAITKLDTVLQTKESEKPAETDSQV